MTKCAKVFCSYFGERRSLWNTPTDIAEFFFKNLQNEILMDNGISTDIIVVNNYAANSEMSRRFLNFFHGQATRDGKILVIQRENRGGSFGAYYDTVDRFKDDYDYWFFCEDDLLIFEPQYLKHFVDAYKSDTHIGFIAAHVIIDLVWKNRPAKLAGGGVGLCSTKKLLEVHNDNIERAHTGDFPLNISYPDMEGFEVEFTETFINKGYEVKNHPEFSPLPINYKKMPYGSSPNTFVNHQLSLNKKFIYQMGEL